MNYPLPASFFKCLALDPVTFSNQLFPTVAKLIAPSFSICCSGEEISDLKSTLDTALFGDSV